MLVRDNNDRYLRDKRSCGGSGEGYSWLLSLPGGFSLGGARHTSRFGLQEGAGRSSLLSTGGETGCGHCGENSPPLQGSVSCCILLHFREWSSAHKSERGTGTLTPQLTKQKTHTIHSGASGETPGPRVPSSSQGASPGCIWEPGCRCPALLLLCHCSGDFFCL